MISNDSVQTLIGSTAYGPDGDKIGSIGQVYLDNDSGAPEWATLKTGLFGTKESFVPLRGAELSGDGVRLPYDKNRIKGAPNIDADQDVSPEEEIVLYEYYGIGVDTTGTRDTGYETSGRPTWSGTDTDDVTDVRPAEDRVTDDQVAGGPVTDGRDVSGTTDDATARSAEPVPAGTETQEAARARLRKYVVSGQQQVAEDRNHDAGVRDERIEADADAAGRGRLRGPA